MVATIAFVPGAALAQTTTSSTTTTSTTSATTTTTTALPATTSTTLAHPCTGRPCTDEPPQLVLSTATTRVQADRGGFCWQRPAEPTRFCVALARPLGYEPPLLVVTEGETVTVTFTPPVPGPPQEVLLATDGALAPLTAANPTTFRVALAPGIHGNMAILTRWLQGEAPYGFRLDVRRAAGPAGPSGGRDLALTG